MDIDLAALPDDVEALQRLVRQMAAERMGLTEAQAEIVRLKLIIEKLQRAQFGRRSEQLDPDQLSLAFEDIEVDVGRAEAQLPPAKEKPARPPRPKLPAHLERKEVRVEPDHTTCPCCGGALHLIGDSVSEMLDHVPAGCK